MITLKMTILAFLVKKTIIKTMIIKKIIKFFQILYRKLIMINYQLIKLKY
jgi:hypothetical protein